MNAYEWKNYIRVKIQHKDALKSAQEQLHRATAEYNEWKSVHYNSEGLRSDKDAEQIISMLHEQQMTQAQFIQLSNKFEVLANELYQCKDHISALNLEMSDLREFKDMVMVAGNMRSWRDE